MTNDKDSLISAMRFNIEEREKYIRCLEEELYQLKKVINAQAISALPELVEACKYAKAGIDDIRRGVCDIKGGLRISQALQQALAKVDGK